MGFGVEMSFNQLFPDICHLTSCSLAAENEKLVDIFIKGDTVKHLVPSIIKDLYWPLNEGSSTSDHLISQVGI